MQKFVFIVDSSALMMQKQDGMTYFQQAIFAIESFVAERKRMNEFKYDKYLLFKTPDINYQQR